MALVIGIDIGTSSTKALLMDETGAVVGFAQESYTFDIPQPGYAEQDPMVWVKAVKQTIRGCLKDSGRGKEVTAISFSGQMHGLVPLGAGGELLEKAIIWCDQRSRDVVERITATIPAEELGDYTANTVSTGSMLASLVWLKESRPAAFEKLKLTVFPKDYVRYHFSGNLMTDRTDAAGSLLYDVAGDRWSSPLIHRLGLDEAHLPAVFDPSDVDGRILPAVAEELGISPACLIVTGGADQAMQALGNGILKPGLTSITIGTGGQVLSPLDRPLFDARLNSHCFSFVRPGSWYFMGATLAAGLSLRWLRDNILRGISYRAMDDLAEGAAPGSGGLYFLPYLIGERTPHMDPKAKGMFFGLTMAHDRSHLIRSVLEGVAFSLRESLEILKGLTGDTGCIVASGGGSASPLWLDILAGVTGQEIYVSEMQEQAAVGAAMNALTGIGEFRDYEEAVEAITHWRAEPVRPDPRQRAGYDEHFQRYQALYEANREIMDSY